MARSGHSPLATRTISALRPLPSRSGPVQAVIIHTTGSGIVRRALREGLQEEKEILDYCAGRMTRPWAYSPHYLVGWDGTIINLVPEGTVAYHAALPRKHVRIYKRGIGIWKQHRGREPEKTDRILQRYDEWSDRWPELDNPVQLVGPGVNSVTIGCDLLAPVPGEQHPLEQLQKMAYLVLDVLQAHGLVVERRTVLRHSDVAPFTRFTKRGGWDPPRASFETICATLGLQAWPDE